MSPSTSLALILLLIAQPAFPRPAESSADESVSPPDDHVFTIRGGADSDSGELFTKGLGHESAHITSATTFTAGSKPVTVQSKPVATSGAASQKKPPTSSSGATGNTAPNYPTPYAAPQYGYGSPWYPPPPPPPPPMMYPSGSYGSPYYYSGTLGGPGGATGGSTTYGGGGSASTQPGSDESAQGSTVGGMHLPAWLVSLLKLIKAYRSEIPDLTEP